MEVILDTPIDIIIVKNIKSYRYRLRDIILNKEVTILIEFFNSDLLQVHQIIKTLTGDEYNNWGADDNYITLIVKSEVDKLYNPPPTIEE